MTAIEDPLLDVLEGLSVPLSLHAGDGRVVFQNAAHVQLFGNCDGSFCHQMLHHRSERCRPCTLESAGTCVGEEQLPDGRRAAVRAMQLTGGKRRLFEVIQVLDTRPEYAELESFVHSAAHDLKTPLVSIKGYADLLQRELQSHGAQPREQTFAARIVQQAQRMEGLLDEMLAFARADTSGGEARDLELATAARTAWSGLLDQAEAAGATLDLDDALPAVLLSPVRLQQVLTNLFSNAIRYRSDGAPLRVAVVCHRPERPAPAGAVCFAVEDNGVGVGVGEEDREHIFRLFHRGPRRGGAAVEGSGIGLAIVKRIVDGAGGAVWVEPLPAGSRFVVCLPAGRSGDV